MRLEKSIIPWEIPKLKLENPKLRSKTSIIQIKIRLVVYSREIRLNFVL